MKVVKTISVEPDFWEKVTKKAKNNAQNISAVIVMLLEKWYKKDK
jgi:predicted CopG family antitoxin